MLFVVHLAHLPRSVRPVLDEAVLLELGLKWPAVLITFDRTGLPPEFRGAKCVTDVGSFHVLIDKRNRHDEVNIIVIDHVGDHADKHRECCVLEVGKLDVHRPELHPPADVRVNSRGRLESQRVPVGRLQVLEMRVAIHRRDLGPPFGKHSLFNRLAHFLRV